jgi:hypothetical protein
MIARRRFSGERRRAAIPITTALSPERTRSMTMMLKTAAKVSVVTIGSAPAST